MVSPELEVRMAGQAGFFDLEERPAGLSRKGDDLERLNAVIDFKLFRPELERAVPRADRSKAAGAVRPRAHAQGANRSD
jgi:hypothetical protein